MRPRRLEHQLFLCPLFPVLHSMGFRTVANELPSADEPMADAYARGEIDELPGSIRMFDGIWLDALRAFNAGLPRGGLIRVRYFDMNHEATAYGEARDVLIDRSASKALLREMARDVLSSSPSFSSSYLAALKGEMLQHYYDRSTISFNYYDNHSCGLLKAMGDLSGGRKACFLPLASPEFSRALDELGEGRGRTSLHPAYDALIVYPRATVIPIPSLAPRG